MSLFYFANEFSAETFYDIEFKIIQEIIRFVAEYVRLRFIAKNFVPIFDCNMIKRKHQLHLIAKYFVVSHFCLLYRVTYYFGKFHIVNNIYIPKI